MMDTGRFDAATERGLAGMHPLCRVARTVLAQEPEA